MFLLKERQRQSHSAGKKRGQDDFAVSRTNRWTGNSSWFPGPFTVQMNPVIQRCGSDEEEEEKTEQSEEYQKVLDLFRAKRGEAEENQAAVNLFESYVDKGGEKDYYQCLQYIIENDIARFDNDDVYGMIYEVNQSVLEYYKCALFDFECELREFLVQKAQVGQYYESRYITILTENRRVWQQFFSVNKQDLDAVIELGEELLLRLLEDKNHILFLINQSTFFPWLQCYIREYTLALGYVECCGLKAVYPPKDFDSLPKIANGIPQNIRISFFQKCKNLRLGKNAIEEIAQNDCMGLLQDNVSVLTSVSKCSRFTDWIKVLEQLYFNGKVILQAGNSSHLHDFIGKPETEEIKIFVRDKASNNLVGDFVYHEHPEVKNGSNKHLKPVRGNSSTPHMDYDKIPDFIKTLLKI